MKPTPIERAHAPLGGSSAHRWVNCPGSIFYQQQLPKELPGEAALMGTQAHECAERMLEDFLQHKLTGSDPTVRASLTYPSDMVDAGQGYVESLWKNVLQETITDKAYMIEEKLTLDENLQMFGYADFVVVYIDDRGKRVGVVVDFKYGYHKVIADKNYQLAFYACALREEIKKAGKDLDYVRAVIFQPRVEPEYHYQEVKFTKTQLETLRKRFFAAAHQIFVKQKPKFKVGSWCEFCPAKAICKSYQHELSKKTTLNLVDIGHTELPSVLGISDTALARIVLHEDELLAFIKECKKYALARARDGKPVAGTKLVSGPVRKCWNEQNGLTAELAKHLPEEKIYNKKVKGITDITRLLKQLYPGSDVQALLAPHLTSTPAKPILVSAEDPRPAFEGAVEMLEVLETTE